MNITTKQYTTQLKTWPTDGQHILAQHDADTIIVYQAYRPSIAQYALDNGTFGGDFSYSRMSWIKPNFLWMMFRSGWGQKKDQEKVLGLRIKRSFFNHILEQAVASSLVQAHLNDEQQWKTALEASNVRLQWDPDHAPNGEKVTRRAIQLGLRRSILERFGKEELLEVIDMSNLIETQRANITPENLDKLITPKETVYQTNDNTINERLKITPWASSR